jgi:release factor glutamine methyltransferase
MNITKALEFGTTQLRNADIPEPEREASSLLRLVIKRDRTFLISQPDYRLDAVESIFFKAVIKRRSAHEPFQYIAGKTEFYGLEFDVTPAVLIPRPETEVLVEGAIERLQRADEARFLEIGVGSGCISISVLANLESATAIGVDISEIALAVAEANAAKHKLTDRIQFIESDLFANVPADSFDAILSNPPYIPSSDIEDLQPEVRDREPRSALDGGADGLDIVRSIVGASINYLKPGAPLMIEIGFGQSEVVTSLFDASFWQEPIFLKDLQGIDRIVVSAKK